MWRVHEQISEEEITKNKQILEEFLAWKCNVPFLYDLVITCALEWPLLTVQWFPSHDQSLHKIFLGTGSSGDNPNYLSITQLHLPPEDAEAELVNGNASWIQIESNKVYSSHLSLACGSLPG